MLKVFLNLGMHGVRLLRLPIALDESGLSGIVRNDIPVLGQVFNSAGGYV